MSDPSKVVTGLVNQANPFMSVAPILDTATKFIIPYVDMLSAQTTNQIVGDPAVAFYVTLMFMVSLIIIILSDRVGWTRNLKYTALSAHLALLRVFRGMITIGLFFVGRRIAIAQSFERGYMEARGFLTTTTVTFVLQKMVEWFSAVAPNAPYTDGVFNPIVDPNSFLQSVFQVVFDYLSLYNSLVFSSMIGGGSYYPQAAVTLLLGDADGFTFAAVSGDKSSGSASTGQVRTLFQLYTSDNIATYENPRVIFAGPWYDSPLFAGLFAGLIA
jgi:hypothetical protein